MFRLQSGKDLELPLFLILSSLVNKRIIRRGKECYPQFLQPIQLKMFGGSSFNWSPFNHKG